MVQFKHQFGKECFIAIGGNFPDTKSTIIAAIEKIASIPEVFEPESSRLYQTTPVSPIPQPLYLNCCLKIKTTLLPLQLLEQLEKIEIELGKEKKPKEAARLIDLDIIFYGNEVVTCDTLIIPHPRWKERLFVLKPLSDLMDVEEILKHFDNVNGEEVIPLDSHLPFERA